MNHEPRFRAMMRDANLADADLPQWLQEAVKCHVEAWVALKAEPGRRDEFDPILQGSDAIICSHVHRIAQEPAESEDFDKLKMLKLKAIALKMQLKPA